MVSCHLSPISTHMPLARHDVPSAIFWYDAYISTHMPLARHDLKRQIALGDMAISTHMPLARHDGAAVNEIDRIIFLLTCLLRGMT